MFAPKATQEDKDKFKGKLNNFIKNMEKLLDENGGEWMVGKGFTWADLYVAVVLNHVSIFSLFLERGKVLNPHPIAVDQEMCPHGL